MSLALILRRAQTHVQRGQIEAALKLYKGLLVTVPNHPQVNAELGMLCLQHRPPQEAIMRQSGFDEEELNKIEQDLNGLPADRVAAVKERIDQQG